jgi:predicted DNA-binding ribbon-helix-helix protein
MTLINRNITIGEHRTSIRLDRQMWNALDDIAQREKCSIHDLCTLVCRSKKDGTTLTSAIRLFLMLYYRAAATEEGHSKAGHGDFKAMALRSIKRETGQPVI